MKFGKKDKEKMLIIFSIAPLLCLSVIGFTSMSVADSVIIQDTDDEILETPILPGEIIIPNIGTGSLGSTNAINAGAIYLIHAQADVTEDNAQNDPEVDPDDGGWDWVLTAPTFTHSASASPTNIYGATALGVYYSYKALQMNSITPNTRYMIAMTDAADKMVAAGTTSIRSASDLIYLMLYDDLPSICGTTYQASAKAKYDARITAYGSAQAFAEYIRDIRCSSYPNGIIAWDIGLWAKVAAMLDERYPGLGYDIDADAIAEVIYQDSFMDNPGCFDIIDDQGFDPTYGNVNYWWYTLGITGLIDAFDAAQVHTSEIPGLLTILDACQYPSGAFSYCYGANTDDEDWQSTAYAVMTLGNLNAYTYRYMIGLAVSWLESTQDPVSGGWIYSSGNHYPEVCGENLCALYFDGPVYNLDTGEVFWSIEAAQDDADTLDGHTILVEPGTYKGNIIIYKQLTIQSETECTAIIDASQIDVCNYKNQWCKGISYTWAQNNDPGLLKNGFLVFVDNVVIDGFNIINALWPSQYNRGIGVIIGSISTTYVSWCPWNVDQWGGTVPNPTQPHPTGVIIRNNCIDTASDGIYNWASNGNIMEYNTIWGSVALGGIGIQCYEGGTDNIIRGNMIDDVDGAGISVCGAWPDYLLDCSNTLVYDNTVTNSNVGIQFYNMGGSGVEAYHNDLLDNNKGIIVEGVGDATVGTAYENNIDGNTLYGIQNTCPTGIFNAKCNWWGDITGPGPIASGLGDSVSTQVSYCTWLDDEYPFGDCSGGAVCWNTRTGIYYCCIQCAIDDPLTLNGDTIEVFALTQVEQINIYKSVTIYGQGIGNTIIQSPDTLTDYFTTSNVNYPIIYINNVDDVFIHNLTVDGAGKGNANYRFVGIGIDKAGAILKDLEIINIRDTPFSGAQHGVAIYGWSDGTGISHDVVVKNCLVYDYQKTGIALGGSDLNVDVNNCEVTGVGPTTVTAQNGIQVSSGATGSIRENEVSGCSYTGPNWAASGILPYLSGGILDISDNIIYENQANIYLAACSADITDNIVTASSAGTGQTYFYGIIGDPGGPPVIPDASPIDEEVPPLDRTTYVFTCTGNHVTGDGTSGGVGIGVYAGMYGSYDIEFTAMNNYVYDWGVGFELYEYAPNNLIYADINYNNIVGNDWGIYNWLTTTYDAECNWYGTMFGPTHILNPLGTGDPVSDYLDYLPWLNLPFDDPNSECGAGICQDIVYVDDDYTSSTPGWYIDHFPTIQIALERLASGGTAYIYNGIYDEDLIIDDDNCDNTGITILGAYGCFPTDYAAIIQGHMVISVNGVTIKYLEFTPREDAAITVEAGVSGTMLEFNKFRRDCITDAIGIQAFEAAIVEADHNWWGAQDGPNGGIMDNEKPANGNGVENIGQVMVEPWIGIHAEKDDIPPPDPMNPGGSVAEVGTPVPFDATGSFAYSFGDCAELTMLPLQYMWDFGDGSQSTNMVTTHIFEQVGTYQVTLMVDSPGIPGLYANFMYDWAYVTVYVVTEDTALACNADGGNLGGYNTIINEPIQLYGGAYGGKGEYNWYWNFGDKTSDSTEQNPIHTYTKPGIYTAKLTVISGSETATDTAEVRVYDIDELFVTINDANTIAGMETLFAASIKGGIKPYSISWDFGDGSTSQEERPTHVYNNPGEYTITVTITDNKQKTATDTATITVQQENIIEEAEIKDVTAGLGVKAVIDAGENNCHWEISVEGMVFLGGENTGIIYANTQDTVKLGFSLAIGKVNIIVKADDLEKQYTAFALGPLYLNLQEI